MPTVGGIVVATGVEASGRRTFLDIIDELARPVNAADTTIRALAADSFRAAVRRMNRKGLWPWEVQEEDVTTTVNSRSSTLSGAVKKPLAMHYLDAAGGNQDRRVAYEAFDRFVERDSMATTSDPCIYTFKNFFETGQVLWFPTPGSVEYLRFTYYRATPVPQAEQEPVEIPDYITDAYVRLAWVEMMGRLPPGQRRMSVADAEGLARETFRELSSHVNSPGDRWRYAG